MDRRNPESGAAVHPWRSQPVNSCSPWTYRYQSRDQRFTDGGLHVVDRLGQETAEAFRASRDKVFDAVQHVVTWGLKHRMLGQIDAIGANTPRREKPATACEIIVLPAHQGPG